MQTPKFKKSKKLVEKQCDFVDLDGVRCEEMYISTCKARYCPTHRKPEFRKIIDKDKIELKARLAKENTANIEFKHSFNKPETIQFACALEGCNETYEIKINPNIYVYPKFCPTHRNEYKRQRFLETRTKTNMQSI